MRHPKCLVAAVALVLVHASDTRAQFHYTDSSSLTGLSEVGDGTTLNNAFRLTDNDNTVGQAGGIWYETEQYLEDGFETHFEFQLSGRSQRGPDGFAFVIQSQSPNELGLSGERLGYNEIVNEVAIEFDTFYDSSQGDVGTDHIAVMVGSSDHDPNFQPANNVVANLNFGTQKHTVHIVYARETLRVYFDDLGEPIVTVPIDLAAVNGGGDPNGTTQFISTIPEAAKGRSYRIELRYSGTGSVDVDNITFTGAGAVPILRGPGLALVVVLLLFAGTGALQRRAPHRFRLGRVSSVRSIDSR